MDTDGHRFCGRDLILQRLWPAATPPNWPYRLIDAADGFLSVFICVHLWLFRQLLQDRDGILQPRQEDHGGDDEGLVAGLLVGANAALLEDVLRDFALGATDAGDVRRQAMHVERFATLGQLHLLLVALPVLVLGIVGEAFLLQLLEPLLVAFVQQRRPPLHHVIRRPRLWIHHIRALECLLHAGDHLKAAAALAAVLPGHFNYFGDEAISLRVGE